MLGLPLDVVLLIPGLAHLVLLHFANKETTVNPARLNSVKWFVDVSGHRTKFPTEISEYFHSSWDTREIWRLDVPRKTLPVGELAWHLDWPFLSSSPPAPLFDLKPRAVLDSPDDFPKHWRRVLAADLSYPVAVASFGDRLVILDGIHRLLKSVNVRASNVECKLVPRSYIRTTAHGWW